MEQRPRSPLRILAPAALAAFAIAVVVVVAGADVSDGGDPRSARQAEQRDLGSTTEAREESRSERGEREEEGLPDDVYVVKEGDTLAAISERVGISVEQLQALNPDLDPQALVSGQQIKLRE